MAIDFDSLQRRLNQLGRDLASPQSSVGAGRIRNEMDSVQQQIDNIIRSKQSSQTEAYNKNVAAINKTLTVLAKSLKDLDEGNVAIAKILDMQGKDFIESDKVIADTLDLNAKRLESVGLDLKILKEQGKYDRNTFSQNQEKNFSALKQNQQDTKTELIQNAAASERRLALSFMDLGAQLKSYPFPIAATSRRSGFIFGRRRPANFLASRKNALFSDSLA